VMTATEELIRYASPVTHLGRMCPVDTDVHGVKVDAGKLISLNWASANFDPTMFKEPETVRLDRKPNPHIAFGNGAHNCLGAPHARLIVRTLLKKLCQHTNGMTLLSAQRKVEKEADYERANAYHELKVQLISK
jgi:cytochrome P450